MQILKKVSLTVLMICNLTACTSTVPAYVPVGCLGLPANNIQFTAAEAEVIPDSAVDKIVEMRNIYKIRINTQCEYNLEHDLKYK